MKHILVISVVFAALFNQHAESAALFNRMMGKVFASVSSCTDDIKDKISPELCLSQFDGENNPNDAQFDACKQAMTCAFKKLDYMTDAGKWNMDKISSLRDDIKEQEAVEEFDNTFKTCSSVDGTNGEAVTNMISCILSGSEKARQSYNDLRETFMSGYDG